MSSIGLESPFLISECCVNLWTQFTAARPAQDISGAFSSSEARSHRNRCKTDSFITLDRTDAGTKTSYRPSA